MILTPLNSRNLFERELPKVDSILLSHSTTITETGSHIGKVITDSLSDINSNILSPFFKRERSDSREKEIVDFKKSLQEEEEEEKAGEKEED